MALRPLGFLAMITIQSTTHVQGITAREIVDFLLNCNDQEYQAWWPGTHLAFHTVKRRCNNLGNLVYMDEWIGRWRVRTMADLVQIGPGNRLVWQLRKLIPLPATLSLELADDSAGVTVLHTIRAGFTGIGSIVDLVIRAFFPNDFAKAMHEHVQTEFSLLAKMIRRRTKCVNSAADCPSPQQDETR
jgi:hypothetical protein